MAEQVAEIGKRRFVERYLFILLLIPTLAVLAGITIYPLIYNIWLSFMKYILTDPTGASFIGVANWVKVFTSSLTLTAFRNTLIFTVCVVTVEFVLGLAIAVLINRPFFGKKVIFTGLLLPIMIAPVACGLIWKYMYNGDFGIIAYILKSLGFSTFALLSSERWALFAVIFQDIWHWTPFLMLIFYSGLLSLPREPYEAARVDGSTNWQIFKDITL
ncbi:sugar ABC transporter permease, partial [Candidatus Aerophobetes bacterium]|nr:sugar ABC transporter permease [Candidatus Aerophobetes bacterium]